MSRIGKLPIKIPSGVTITVDNATVSVAGSKGNLSEPVLKGITFEQADEELVVKRISEEALYKGNHGLMRTLIQNMVIGVTEGFNKKLELHGVGFRVALAGSQLKMNLGLSHEVIYQLPQGISASVEQNVITVSGISKQRVGQAAAEIRELKKPEPYKGKGIRYQGEHIIRKSGKSGKDK